MKKALLLAFLAVFCGNSQANAQSDDRYLVLNFDCYGGASGRSSVIGDSLRYHLRRAGAKVVSEDLTRQLMRRRKLNESDLNYMPQDLKGLMTDLNADAAVYGHVLSSNDILTVELRMIQAGNNDLVLLDPIVCGDLADIFFTIPRMAELILAPDKSAPIVLSVQPGNGTKEVEQYIEMAITFSKPMNPSTHSIAGFPENMWKRFGDVTYIDSTRTFLFKIHLYPNIDYEFHVNGAEAKGFKDVKGNVASEYIWRFSTGSW